MPFIPDGEESVSPERKSSFVEDTPVQRSLAGKAWDLLGWSERKSKEGFGRLREAASKIPSPDTSGNLTLDLIQGAPRILAESAAETAEKVAPGFVSPAAMLVSGGLAAGRAASPLIRAVGGGLGRAAEGISGLAYKHPGVLGEAANDASLIFSPGRKVAGEAFAEIAAKGNVNPKIASLLSHTEVVKAAKTLANNGTLTPEGSLVARQSLDAIKKTVPRHTFFYLRDIFDGLAKQVSKEADIAFTRAGKAEDLRSLWSFNTTGKPSIAKTAISSALHKGVSLPFISPLVQGATATALGAGARGAVAAQEAGAGPAIGAAPSLVRAIRGSYSPADTSTARLTEEQLMEDARRRIIPR